MTIDYKREFLSFLKRNNAYTIWRYEHLEKSLFNESIHLFFQIVPPSGYFNTAICRHYTKLNVLHKEWLLFCIKHDKSLEPLLKKLEEY